MVEESNKDYKKSDGISWFSMRLKLSKTSTRADGKLFWDSKLGTDCFFQVLRFKILWQNFGPYSISLCPNYLIIMSNFKNGSQRILSSTRWIRVSSTSISWRDSIWFFNHSCWGVWKKMSKVKLRLKQRRLFLVLCLIDNRYYMTESRQKFQQLICLCLQEVNQSLRISWTWSCNSEKYVIIQIYSKEEWEKFHMFLPQLILEWHTICIYQVDQTFLCKMKIQFKSSYPWWSSMNAS